MRILKDVVVKLTLNAISETDVIQSHVSGGCLSRYHLEAHHERRFLSSERNLYVLPSGVKKEDEGGFYV